MAEFGQLRTIATQKEKLEATQHAATKTVQN